MDQLSEALQGSLSGHMSGFLKGHSYENVLMRFTENCKSTMDSNNLYGAILTDLSKAFDCLAYRLVISKLMPMGSVKRAVRSLVAISRRENNVLR